MQACYSKQSIYGLRFTRPNTLARFTVSKKMAACHQNVLRASSKNSEEKITRSKANGIKFQHK